MANSIDNINWLYNQIFYELPDYRSKDYWFLNPIFVVAFIFLYIWFALKIGPDFMKNRPAYNLKKFILVFDAVQIAVNAWTCIAAFQLGWSWKNSLFCTEVQMEDTERTRQIVFLCYVYYLIKISDLLDTVFFVLGKKTNHISFLHVYHHSGMIAMTFVCAKYMPGGHHTFIGQLNTFVHVIMYTYYLVTTIYPQKKLFKFKKLVTELQMYQFLILFIHMGLPHFITNCKYNKWPNFFLLPNFMMMFILFYDFYKKAYFPKEKKKT